MNDMRATIIAKSDQLNSDDLIGGRALTITVTRVEITMAEQPVSIYFEGDDGKPYKPGKSMRRVLVNVWGPDANAYVGRSMTLYRDDHVKFGGLEVGGIRISHMSHMNGEMTMALTATRAVRKPFTVKPLATPVARLPPPPAKGTRYDADGETYDANPALLLEESNPIEWMRNLGKLLRQATTEPEVVEISGHYTVVNALKEDAPTPPKIRKNINDMMQDAYERVRHADDGSSASEDPLDALLDKERFPG